MRFICNTIYISYFSCDSISCSTRHEQIKIFARAEANNVEEKMAFDLQRKTGKKRMCMIPRFVCSLPFCRSSPCRDISFLSVWIEREREKETKKAYLTTFHVNFGWPSKQTNKREDKKSVIFVICPLSLVCVVRNLPLFSYIAFYHTLSAGPLRIRFNLWLFGWIL